MSEEESSTERYSSIEPYSELYQARKESKPLYDEREAAKEYIKKVIPQLTEFRSHMSSVYPKSDKEVAGLINIDSENIRNSLEQIAEFHEKGLDENDNILRHEVIRSGGLLLVANNERLINKNLTGEPLDQNLLQKWTDILDGYYTGKDLDPADEKHAAQIELRKKEYPSVYEHYINNLKNGSETDVRVLDLMRARVEKLKKKFDEALAAEQPVKPTSTIKESSEPESPNPVTKSSESPKGVLSRFKRLINRRAA